MLTYQCAHTSSGVFSLDVSFDDYEYFASKRFVFTELLTIDQLLNACDDLVSELRKIISNEIKNQYTYCDTMEKEIKNRCERAEKLENILANRF